MVSRLCPFHTPRGKGSMNFLLKRFFSSFSEFVERRPLNLMASSSLFSTLSSLSLLLTVGALISAALHITDSMAMAMATGEKVDSMALLPFGAASGSFFRAPQCGGPRRTAAQAIGVCYGTIGDDLPNATEVIQLYKAHNIKKMRIYNPNVATLNALRGSNIELTLGIANNQLQHLTNLSSASNWVKNTIQPYTPHVKFRYITAGNAVRPSDASAPYVLSAIRSLHAAIAAAKLQDQIQVSTAISTAMLGTSFPPSAASFSSQFRGFIAPIVGFLAEKGLPLLASVHPYFTYIDNSQRIDLDHVLFKASRAIFLKDGDLPYYNVFEAIVDALDVALEKLGAANMTIVVSESGWPSGGDVATSVENADSYYRNLISFVQAGGTPRRPRRALETFLFAMFDENLKFPELEKHFGLFTPSKKPKYQLSFG